MPNERGRRGGDNAANALDGTAGLSRDRPWLLPSNRKLRHLQGISLRNLAITPPHTRKRGQTIDDESLPYALNTPAKLLAQKEAHKLGLSRSSTDLRSSPTKTRDKDVKLYSDSDIPPLRRPSNGKLRRRSTLNWSNAPPRVRQERLENVARERMADTWFSLYCTGLEEPIYVSEIVEKAMNPSFRFFDLNIYGPTVTRLDELTVKYWAKTEKMQSYILLIELQLCLRSLQFIGKSIENFHHPLPLNCILFHLSDGIYTSFTDLPLDNPVRMASRSTKPSHGLQYTSSFDALMRLSNLDDCIQDALSTRENLASQISNLLKEQKQSHNTINEASQAEQSLASTTRAVAKSRNLLKSAQARRSELQASLKSRHTAIASGRDTQQQTEPRVLLFEEDLFSQRSLLRTTQASLSGQIRRICEDLLFIYPIEPVENKALSFTVRGLRLPNAASTSALEADPAVTAAALNYVAHLIYLLSLYLSTPIPYPPTPHGSTSTVLDPVSTNIPSVAARTFPLYQKGAVTYRFEYGVFLLNSDIELLMSKQGSRMVDLRHTLPNLKYLLTVLTDGKGELPLRKKGGAKLSGNGQVTAERRISDQSSVREKTLHSDGKLPETRVLSGENI